jgi:AraC family transcriptional regulator
MPITIAPVLPDADLTTTLLKVTMAWDSWQSTAPTLANWHRVDASELGLAATQLLLQERCAGHEVYALDADALAAEMGTLVSAYQGAASDAALIAAARALIARITASMDLPQATLDPRIKRAVDLIRARVGDATIPLADIAEAAHLSPARFRHLFLEQTGIRFRPYVLWLRMEVALAAYGARRNLTEAAQSGGFAYSAHFSRSFKSMFGIAPSAIQID